MWIPKEKSKLSLTKISQSLSSVKLNWKQKGTLAGLWNDWPRIAGEQLAAYCQPIGFINGVLVIGASHPQWLQALQYNRPQLLASLKAAGHKVKDIRIQKHHKVPKKVLESESIIWGKHPSRIDVHGLATCPKCNSPSPAGEIDLWSKCGLCRRKDL